MNMHERLPLDDEERQLAAQLARIAPRGEPSAELDARILAIAERTVAGNPAPARRRRPSWPAWLGVAASLTAVAGLIWQVHPILAPSTERIAPVAISSADHATGDGDERQPIRYVEPIAEMAPPTPPPPPLPSPSPPQRNAHIASAPAVAPAAAKAPEMADSLPAATQAPPRISVPAKPAQNTPITADIAGAPEPAASTEVAPTPWPADAARKATPASSTRSKASDSVNAAPPPPVASSPAVDERSEASGNRLPSARSVAAPMPAPTATPPASSDTLEFDERPPATTANIDVQKAWLERIRTLKNTGKLDEARQSLKEFRQRHPNAEIPADLKPVLTTGTP